MKSFKSPAKVRAETGPFPDVPPSASRASQTRQSPVTHVNLRKRVWLKTPPHDTLSASDSPKCRNRMPLTNVGYNPKEMMMKALAKIPFPFGSVWRSASSYWSGLRPLSPLFPSEGSPSRPPARLGPEEWRHLPPVPRCHSSPLRAGSGHEDEG